MKVLVLSPWFPSPPFGGALIRVYQTLRYLSRRHQLTLLAPISRVPSAEHLAVLTDLCERVIPVPVSDRPAAVLRRMASGLARGLPLIQGVHRDRRIAGQLRALTSAHDYDIVHVEHSFMAPYLASISPQSGARTVLSMHNVESLRFRRELQTARGARRLALLTDSVLFDSWEERAVRRFDGIATVSALEEAWARVRAPSTPIAVVPNGVDTDYFVPTATAPASRALVFAALMNYPPNIDAAVWFCDAVLPLIIARHPDVRFRIVGDKPTPQVLALARRPGVEVTGRVPDVRPHMAEAPVVVVPLRSGAGTRLKILEAMAMGRPVVSTRLGAEGLQVTDGVHLLLGDTPAALAAHVSAVLERPDLGAALSNAGRRLTTETYDWRSCLTSLDELFDRVTHASARSRPPAGGIAS